MEPTETTAENPSRARILERIRTALRTPAARPAGPADRKIFAPVTDMLDRFQKECAANITECVVTPDMRASARAVADVLAALPPGEIFVQDSSALRRLATEWQDGRKIQWSSEGGPRESAQATITAAEALVALTGSVLVSAACRPRGIGGRAGSHCDREPGSTGPRPGSSFRAHARAKHRFPEFLCLPHYRFKPDRRHREDPGDGRAWAGAIDRGAGAELRINGDGAATRSKPYFWICSPRMLLC